MIYLYLEDFQESVLDQTSFFRSTRHLVAAADVLEGSHRAEHDPAPLAPVAGNGETAEIPAK